MGLIFKHPVVFWIKAVPNYDSFRRHNTGLYSGLGCLEIFLGLLYLCLEVIYFQLGSFTRVPAPNSTSFHLIGHSMDRLFLFVVISYVSLNPLLNESWVSRKERKLRCVKDLFLLFDLVLKLL